MLTRKSFQVFLVILFASLLYLIEIFLYDFLYPIVKPGFMAFASCVGIPEWGRIMADFSPTHFLIGLACFFSFAIKGWAKLLFYSSILFLFEQCVEWAVLPLWTSGTYSMKIIVFALLMLIVGTAICFLFFRIGLRFKTTVIG